MLNAKVRSCTRGQKRGGAQGNGETVARGGGSSSRFALVRVEAAVVASQGRGSERAGRDERSSFGGLAPRRAAGETAEREVVDGGGSGCVLAVGHLSMAVSAGLKGPRSSTTGPRLAAHGSRSFRARGNVEQVYRRRGVGRHRVGEESLASHLGFRLAVVLRRDVGGERA